MSPSKPLSSSKEARQDEAGFSWMWKDWRVWMLLFIIVAVAILYLMTLSSSEVVQKTKVGPVRYNVDQSQGVQDSNGWFNFLIIFSLLVVVPVAVFSFRVFRKNMIFAFGVIIAAVFLYTRMWSSTFENNSTANATQVSTTIDGGREYVRWFF